MTVRNADEVQPDEFGGLRNVAAPWHKESFDRFLAESLPELLAARLPLAGYSVEPAGPYDCLVRIALRSESGELTVDYAGVAKPDARGVFEVDGVRKVVLPVASQADLETAEVRCVGEQLRDAIAERLGEAPDDLPWDESLARLWLPLGKWVREFLTGAPTAQVLDDRNWLATCAHLRRLSVSDHNATLLPSHFGRVCPYETPEGPNIGRILSLAVDAVIRDGKIEVADNTGESFLGVTASMVPFIEHNDSVRQLMGVNMMRQWFVPPDPEPALVQTGNEPDAPGFWCGRNLLTAYISWGPETYEDAILISESCAKRLNYPTAIEPGDKLSNRHGTKGTVSRIAPDDEMPHLADGTPVELVFNFIGAHTRLNFGQFREAIMGRIAHAEGTCAIVPPFHAPDAAELRERLAEVGLPQTGMETLTVGRGGQSLERPSLVGWVYWGKLHHLAGDKLHVSVDGGRAQRSGELEYYTLRNAGAFENIAEQFNTRSAERENAAGLAARVAAGQIEQAGPPTPAFAELVRRLQVAGVKAELSGDKLRFSLSKPEGELLQLAVPVAHPWLRGRELCEVGKCDDLPVYRALEQVNTKAERMLASGTPAALREKAVNELAARVRDFFDALIGREHVRLGGRVLFSGRAVLSPALDLRYDQAGLADEIAWTLFGPLVVRELRDESAVAERTPRATEALDDLMSRSWVLINRAPSNLPTSFIACRPVRYPDRVLRLHPLACMMLNADFDGDQAAVFLPLTEAGQNEAAERLSIVGHLRRDPSLTEWIVPSQDAFWGLAHLSITAEGREEIEALAGTSIDTPEGLLTRPALIEAMRGLLARNGAEHVMEACEQLMRRGFAAVKESGASISPFVGTTMTRPPASNTDNAEVWKAYADELEDDIASGTSYDDPTFGPQLLAVKSRSRGQVRQLSRLVGARGHVNDVHGEQVIVRHGWAEGVTVDEALACVVGAREGLVRVVLECEQTGYGLREIERPQGFNVLARAMRAQTPGIVLARAAAADETDPLTDVDSRLFVGLPVGR